MYRSMILAALIALAATGCAFTGANRVSPDGRSSWSAHGVALFETPADGYAKTAQADASLLFAQTVAAQRAAIVQAAYVAAAGGGRDVVAREEIALTQEAVEKLAASIEEDAAGGGR